MSLFTQNLTTINIAITPVFLIKTAGGVGAGFFILKFFSSGIFWRLFAGFWGYANKKYSEAQINRIVKKIKKSPDLSTYKDGLGKKIKYELKSDLHYDDIDEDETILIALDAVKNSPANVTNTIVQYVSKSLLPQASMTLEEKLKKGICYLISRNVISSQNLIAARQYIDSKLLPQEYRSDPDFEKMMESLRQINVQGLLSRILLQQFHELNKLEFETFEYSKLKKETERFYEFIHGISIRAEHDERTNLKFDGEFIKVRVIFVASGKSARLGPMHLIGRINNQVDFDYVYLICPAINRDMKPRPHVPAWRIYREVLRELKTGSHRFSIARSHEFNIKNPRAELFEIGVSFLIKNY